MIGKTLAHYEVTAEIGKGGMGEVYRARDTKLGREVALKFLPPDFAADPDRLSRFEREARVLASLSHSNIATIHGLEQHDENRFLVLELVEGEDLAQRLARGPIPTLEAISIALQIAEGVEAAHAQGIIHRDLKPANIKQTGDGGVKVLDFGLARVNEPDQTTEDIQNSPTLTLQTRDGVVLGTAPYMSPEQLKGRPVDGRTDIWAFGCVLYEMLTGDSPFFADSAPEIMVKILDREPAWDKLPRDLRPSVHRLLRRCLVKDPRHRLHSAADIRILLKEALETEPEAEHQQTEPRKTSALRTGIVAAVAFLLGALAVGVATRQSGPSSEDAGAPVRLMIPVRDEISVVPMPGEPSVAISPDGKHVVYVTSGENPRGHLEESSNTLLYLRPMDGFEAVPIEGTAGASGPFFSPDGQWVGYFNWRNGQILKVALNGGTPQVVCFVKEQGFRGAHWADTGKIYFSNSFMIFSVDENGGEPEVIAKPNPDAGEKTYRFPNHIPGSRALLFTRGLSDILSYDDADIALLDLDSGEIRILAQGGSDPQYIPTGHIVYGRAGKIFALPFDIDGLEVTGSPRSVLDGVVTSEGYGGLQMSCSNTGTLIYVAGGPQQFATELMILNRDGRIENIPQQARPYGEVSLDPKGNRMCISVLGANASLWIYELQRGTMTKLVSGWDNYSPVWDQAGNRIVFGSNRNGRNAVWITASDGSGSPRPVIDDDSNGYPSSWSPDGKWIAVSQLSPNKSMDIWLVDDQGNGQPAIQTEAREARGKFSPDGRYLAYTSDESGQLEVYVQALAVTGRKWKLSEDGGDLPMWSREGDGVYYWNSQRLMKVPVVLDPDFRPARAGQVLETAVEVQSYDVFPEGDRFVILGRRPTRNQAASSIYSGAAQGRLYTAQSPDLHVVLNWFDELAEENP